MNNKYKPVTIITAIFLIVGIFCACGNNSSNNTFQENKTEEKTTQPPRSMAGPDKSNDTELKALLTETVDKFVQLEFNDAETGKTMSYNLFIPENYDKNIQYPLLLFMADASTVNKDTKVPLTQGYGGVIWASAKDQAKHPCFILVPQYTTQTVNDKFETSYEVEMTIRLLNKIVNEYNIDKNRLYTTGQSMGGMMSMYFNITHPDLFAASLYVGCQWDTEKMGNFGNDKFFYIVAAGDEKAPKGMEALRKVLENKGAKISIGEWSAKLPETEQEVNVQKLLAEKNNINFIIFTLGSVLPEDSRGNEHMYSFDYAYKLESVRDWLFNQKK